MDERVRYLVFCIETYKHHHGLTGSEAYDVFKKFRFDDYIFDLYELLHIQGTKRLLEELDEYRYSQERINA